MKIELANIGKKYRNEWIFRNTNLTFSSNESYTFVGPNGSGKSTLLQVIAGSLPQSEGQIAYIENGEVLSIEEFYKKITIAAPYLELIEEFTLLEMVDFHIKFKPLKNNISPVQFLELIQLAHHKNKSIKNFSSGMKQRLKLGLAFYSDCPVIMLDEPTSNLDAQASGWYLSQVEQHTQNRLLIICSNQPQEYTFCKNIIDIRDYKLK
ncbi:ATP-binding cassette domain-containing protein [Emticicia sp. 21SJ11W-3]|uniref:ABC transporter ATP-binding protein n=1 Tax=Emticicia sp. 21SJ11W-3 TaxID=2916755 RepID=UPI00209DDFFC|nr:ATP-binding cassette domain-containing protein [Emticicia sp. 21SJ11W-3]UTA69128.1 ATP-binding cassette domain-containing protein [Emticicia sp. 21SJ11W-3]